MPFDANGTFKRNYNWEDDREANIAIKANRHDADHDDFAQGLSGCVTRDGRGKFTAPIDANGNRVMNVSDASKGSDAATLSQVQRGLDYA